MHSRHHGHSGRSSRPASSSAAASRAAASCSSAWSRIQRDLEQQLADVTDVIAHLRDPDETGQPQQI